MSKSLTIVNPITGEERKIPEGVTLRLGLPEDYDSVRRTMLEVNWLDGWDYFPGHWRKWVKDPNKIIVVAVVQGEVVCTDGIRVTNRGRHWVSFGARCSPKHQANNIHWACNAYKKQILLERFAQPEKSLAAVENVVGTLRRRKEGKSKFDIASLGNFFFIGRQVTLEDLLPAYHHIMSGDHDGVVVEAIRYQEELADLFANPASRYDLFPTGYFLLSYEVFEAIPESAHDVWDQERQIAISRQNGRPQSITFGTLFPCLTGTGYNIESNGQLSTNVVLAHVKHHFPFIRAGYEKYGGKITIFLNATDGFDFAPLVKLFHKDLKLDDRGNGIRPFLAFVSQPVKFKAKV